MREFSVKVGQGGKSWEGVDIFVGSEEVRCSEAVQ
jgi:hypothetical protein